MQPPLTPFPLETKAEVLKMNYNVPHDRQCLHTDLLACGSSRALMHSCWLLGHAKQDSTTGPLHLLFPLPEILFPHLLFSLTFKCHYISYASQNIIFKMVPPYPCPWHFIFSCGSHLHLTDYIFNLFIFSIVPPALISLDDKEFCPFCHCHFLSTQIND